MIKYRKDTRVKRGWEQKGKTNKQKRKGEINTKLCLHEHTCTSVIHLQNTCVSLYRGIQKSIPRSVIIVNDVFCNGKKKIPWTLNMLFLSHPVKKIMDVLYLKYILNISYCCFGEEILQYSSLENSMDKGDWRATVPWIAKCRTQPSD